MKFIDLTTITNLSRDRMAVGVSALAISTMCVVAFVGVYTMLDNKARQQRIEREVQASILAQEAIEAAATATTTTEETEMTETTELVPVVQSEVTETIEATGTLETTSVEEPTETVNTEVTTTTTRDPNYVEEYYATVYCTHDINLRSGPGTGYDVVRVLHVGDEITVTGRTDSGWYRTYSGNYVLQNYTSTTPVATTAAATTATTTAAQTAAATTAATQPAQSPNAGSIDGMSYYGQCRITFYGPQPRSDGSYSTTTATGTQCSEGRTLAADWSVFPAGTTLYLPNDPLGGDGYYTVEDRGPGVNGSHLDLFANAASSHTVTTCDVYVVN
ncbi:MAG: SH3 domain-containing protein [Saccharofermentans sp.]|nr:SH3 domain-containing protein [Saccharofermentans sp.]